jgi:UDPglucose 6-dehydrogenase
VVITDPSSAETIKYASNAFLATKLSFINAIAALCESIGADVGSVTAGMGLDPRIGSDYLQPGPGWGGSCFPKDTRALVRIAEDAGYDFKLLKGTIEANDEQYDRIARKVQALVGGSLIGTVVGQWGLTFKAGTDDLRCSPALEVARRIVDAGATVHAYDPTVTTDIEGIDVVSGAAAACVGADVLLVATEWEEFRAQDFNEIGKTMNRRAILDARNWLIPGALKRAGFQYEGIGLT